LAPTTTISRQLNLVVPVDREDGTRLHVHSQPLGYDQFKTYWLVLSKTWAEVTVQGLREISGPRVALRLLQEVAQNTVRARGLSWWEGDDGVERGLVGELVRLSNVLVPAADGGWGQTPLDTAIKQRMLGEEEADFVLGQVTFFTLTWRLADLSDRADMAAGAARLHGSSTTPSSATDYASSLRTSTAEETTGEKTQRGGARSSPPSSPTPQEPAGQTG
jgi:hypothetical protein